MIVERNAAHEKALTEDLTQMASAWPNAKDIRAFLSAVVERVPAGEISDGWRKWMAWADRCADKLDPLSVSGTIPKVLDPPEPRSPWGR